MYNTYIYTAQLYVYIVQYKKGCKAILYVYIISAVLHDGEALLMYTHANLNTFWIQETCQHTQANGGNHKDKNTQNNTLLL